MIYDIKEEFHYVVEYGVRNWAFYLSEKLNQQTLKNVFMKKLSNKTVNLITSNSIAF